MCNWNKYTSAQRRTKSLPKASASGPLPPHTQQFFYKVDQSPRCHALFSGGMWLSPNTHTHTSVKTFNCSHFFKTKPSIKAGGRLSGPVMPHLAVTWRWLLCSSWGEIQGYDNVSIVSAGNRLGQWFPNFFCHGTLLAYRDIVRPPPRTNKKKIGVVPLCF